MSWNRMLLLLTLLLLFFVPGKKKFKKLQPTKVAFGNITDVDYFFNFKSPKTKKFVFWAFHPRYEATLVHVFQSKLAVFILTCVFDTKVLNASITLPTSSNGSLHYWYKCAIQRQGGKVVLVAHSPRTLRNLRKHTFFSWETGCFHDAMLITDRL